MFSIPCEVIRQRLARTLCALGALLSFCHCGFAFEYFEHRAIGRIAYKMAKEKVFRKGIPLQLADAEEELKISDADKKCKAQTCLVAFDYGDLTALAGDLSSDENELKVLGQRLFYELNPDKQTATTSNSKTYDRLAEGSISGVTRRQILNACNWMLERGLAISGTNECFDGLMPVDKPSSSLRPYSSAGYVASRAERAAFEKVPGFVELASKNGQHFPTASWKAYKEYHKNAVEVAEKDMAKALLFEAMAQHFLHDSFASGHIGTDFGECNLRVICFPSKTLIQHTHDSLNRLGLDIYLRKTPKYLHNNGEMLKWTAFGDGSLFIPEAAFHRWVITKFATNSMKEVFLAAKAAKPQLTRDFDFFPRPVDPVPTTEARNPDEPDKLKDLTADSEEFPSLTKFKGSRFSGRSRDLRVHDLTDEGWKVSAGLGSELKRNARTLNPFQDTRTAAILRLDYVRPVAFAHQIGIEYGLASSGTRLGLHAGRALNKSGPFTAIARVGILRRVDSHRADLGLNDETGSTTEIQLISFDFHLQFYKPASLFFSIDVLNYDLNNHRAILARKSGSRHALGLRLDFSEIP